MQIYAASVYVKRGREAEAEQYFRDLEPLLCAAPGYRGRQVLRARPGAFAEAVWAIDPDMGSRERHGPDGTQFITIEYWDRPDDRVAFVLSSAYRQTHVRLIRMLQPEHSHEFFDVVPVGDAVTITPAS
jgi:heme-degrading monooxygenase HmoA